MPKRKAQPQKPSDGDSRIGLIERLHALFERAVLDDDLSNAARLADVLLKARSLATPDLESSLEPIRDSNGQRCPTCSQRLRPVEIHVTYDDQPPRDEPAEKNASELAQDETKGLG